jgi:hypothetical protein
LPAHLDLAMDTELALTNPHSRIPSSGSRLEAKEFEIKVY